ncbi:hypothetical protein L211DRAFT_161335 [Terfezia boudieri ATCC MYA-4762]|uniref:Uncharacterized protein n=1 Tax=Terfezia boudieri ATCC MYA-4762 TaxID=1051890 RepID=A0A3N4M287_9PEZI|nr:hypothetical protein L211DRAFT_161335 [Terfezia boudieri ATCC MYA-4762]
MHRERQKIISPMCSDSIYTGIFASRRLSFSMLLLLNCLLLDLTHSSAYFFSPLFLSFIPHANTLVPSPADYSYPELAPPASHTTEPHLPPRISIFPKPPPRPLGAQRLTTPGPASLSRSCLPLQVLQPISRPPTHVFALSLSPHYYLTYTSLPPHYLKSKSLDIKLSLSFAFRWLYNYLWPPSNPYTISILFLPFTNTAFVLSQSWSQKTNSFPYNCPSDSVVIQPKHVVDIDYLDSDSQLRISASS